MNDDYPVRFSVDYPDRDLNRLTTFFRIFTVIPIAIVIGTYRRLLGRWRSTTTGRAPKPSPIGGTGLLFLPPLLMILFRQKYPRWWFDWNLELCASPTAWGPTSRCSATTTRRPTRGSPCTSTSTIRTPRDLNRWLPLVKWFLAIPHFVVLFLLYLARSSS